MFNVGDIIQHKDANDDRYYYIVLDTFNTYTSEYYNLFCFVGSREVTLRLDNSKNYRVVSKA
jgi:hypothetical protein